jgi:hypothetical protein
MKAAVTPESEHAIADIAQLCNELAARYAVFPSTRRLAIQINAVTKVFDTGEHRGVQEQQGGGYGSVRFTSRLGTFGVSSPARGRRAAGGRTARPALTRYSVAGWMTTTDLVREPSSRSSAITRPSASLAA